MTGAPRKGGTGSSSGRGRGPAKGGKAPARGGRPTGRPARRQAPVPAVPVDVHDEDGVRLQKVLAQAGVGSRRACEALIAAGRVQVDGHVVVEQGVRIDPTRQVVHVDGVRVQLDEDKTYLAFNKPAGVVSTMSDEQGRVSLGDFMSERPERLFHVGRLDSETEGLILLTNDGDLAHRLQHPSYGVAKTYLAEVPGPVARDVGKRLRAGVELEDGPVARRQLPADRLPARQGAGRAGHPRGPQAHRPARAGGGRSPGRAPRARAGRADPPR